MNKKIGFIGLGKHFNNIINAIPNFMKALFERLDYTSDMLEGSEENNG